MRRNTALWGPPHPPVLSPFQLHWCAATIHLPSHSCSIQPHCCATPMHCCVALCSLYWGVLHVHNATFEHHIPTKPAHTCSAWRPEMGMGLPVDCNSSEGVVTKGLRGSWACMVVHGVGAYVTWWQVPCNIVDECRGHWRPVPGAQWVGCIAGMWWGWAACRAHCPRCGAGRLLLNVLQVHQ